MSAGYVKVFEWTGDIWLERDIIWGEARHDQIDCCQYTRHIALADNGNVLAVGADGNDGNGTNRYICLCFHNTRFEIISNVYLQIVVSYFIIPTNLTKTL